MTELNDFNQWRTDNFPQQLDRDVPNPAKPPVFYEWDTEQCSQVSGIGPALAKRIVDAGPFTTLTDVKQVKGISEKVMSNLQSLLT